MGQNQSHSVNDVFKAKASSNSKTNAGDESGNGPKSDQGFLPEPTGHEYDEIDKLQAELPSMIDEESRQQVNDYIEACDKGKGPMAACFATGEFLGMFERKVRLEERNRIIMQLTLDRALMDSSYVTFVA